MKTIGLIGGMSWESTAVYYASLNRAIASRLGGYHSARMILHSVDFHEYEDMMTRGAWDETAEKLSAVARSLEIAGAEFLVLATNTMHRVADAVASEVRMPLLHIADATADAVRAAGVTRVGLLGTRFTMEQDFYRARLERHGLVVSTPDADERDVVHRVIFDELCRGEIRDASRDAYRRIIGGLADSGAEGVILGCTEISLLVGADDSPVPVFDTTQIHVEAAADRAISGT